MASSTKRENERVVSAAGHSYLDGIPVKIGEKFRPPRKITLPLSYQQRCPVEILNEEYDFSLENQVLELAETKRRGKEAAERAKSEKLSSTIEEFTRLYNSTETRQNGGEDFWRKEQQANGTPTTKMSQLDNGNSNSDATMTNEDGVHSSAPRAATLEPNSMLKPVLTQSGTSESRVSVKPDVTITSKLNLEDFESETSPFDSMALKTLNDLEELRSVLQNVNLPVNHRRSVDGDSVTERKAIGDESSLQTNGNGFNNNETSSEDSVSLRKRDQQVYLASSLPICAVGSTNLHGMSNEGGISYPSIAPGMMWSFPVTGPLPQQPSSRPMALSNGHVSCPNDRYPPVNPQDLVSKFSPSDDMYATVVPLRNSRSTPDLLKELGATLAAERERKKMTPPLAAPQRPSSAGPTGITAPVPPSLKTNRSSVGVCSRSGPPSKSRLTNSTSETDTDCQSLVRHITDMGFPRARVTRAVQKLGDDDKKHIRRYEEVVEHLCLVQAFVELGYNAEDAEAALYLNDHNEAQAKIYLELMTQFKDLGFDEELIKKALLHSKNDRDKALDYLVS